MKSSQFALALLLSASAANAAYISFSPASVSIPRGGVSQEITLRISGDYASVAAETRLNLLLSQLDFVR